MAKKSFRQEAASSRSVYGFAIGAAAEAAEQDAEQGREEAKAEEVKQEVQSAPAPDPIPEPVQTPAPVEKAAAPAKREVPAAPRAKKAGAPKKSDEQLTRFSLVLPLSLREYLELASYKASSPGKRVSLNQYICDLIEADKKKNQSTTRLLNNRT